MVGVGFPPKPDFCDHKGNDMPGLPRIVLEHALANYGVTSRHQLIQIGIDTHRIERWRHAGLLSPLIRGTYAVVGIPIELNGWCRAVCLAEPDAIITGRAALKLYNLRRGGDPYPIEIRANHFTNHFQHPMVRIRRCNVIEPIDWVLREDGIRVVSPPRLVFDAAAVLTDLDLESVIEQIIDNEWCTMDTISAMGDRLIHRSRPGTARFTRVLARRPAWRPAADSHLEVVLFDALRRAGVDGLVRQHPIRLPGGWTIHVDIAVPAERWAIPIDHVTWHGGRLDAQRDKQNDRQARRIGWHVDRVTDDDIADRLNDTVAELLELRTIHARDRSA